MYGYASSGVLCMSLLACGCSCCIEGSVLSLAEGEVQVTRGGEVRQVMKPAKVFGELAILYNCTRTATIKALTSTKVCTMVTTCMLCSKDTLLHY